MNSSDESRTNFHADFDPNFDLSLSFQESESCGTDHRSILAALLICIKAEKTFLSICLLFRRKSKLTVRRSPD